MFDISFAQLLLALTVGLVVLGPKRLPVVIRTVAGWVAVLRRISATARSELEKELAAQEVRENLRKVEESVPLEDIKQTARVLRDGSEK
ncbi:hypothetical protein FACS1894206_00300 [Deltaproteobacteria bacterium]|nr:hypothetical protein FACS1894206_00300 [Deltaproteobacteria bacterium]